MKRLATAVALGAAAVGVTALAAPAGAVPPNTSVYVAQHCVGPSPNIIDFPYAGGLSVTQTRAGVLNISYGNPSIWGYHTDATISWKNLRTGAHGSVPVHFDRNLGSNSTGANPVTGAGTIRLTTRATNRGPLLTLRAPVCSGTVVAR